MKRVFLPLLLLLLLTGCAAREPEQIREPESAVYTQIDQETAMRMMEQDDGRVIIDVRRQDEYDEGHIPGAILNGLITLWGNQSSLALTFWSSRDLSYMTCYVHMPYV